MGNRAIILAQNLPPFGGNRPRQTEKSSFESGATGGKSRFDPQLHWRHRAGRKEDYARNACENCKSPQMSRPRSHLGHLIFSRQFANVTNSCTVEFSPGWSVLASKTANG